MHRLIPIAACLLPGALPGAVNAAERTLSVNDFDRIRVEGSFVVVVTTARATTARVSGAPGAVETAQLTVQGRTLIIRRDRGAWSSEARRDMGAATVRVTLPALQAASLSGAGTLTIDSLRGARASLSVEGSGRIAVARVDADRLDVGVVGSGTIALAGTAKDFGALLRGSGSLDAGALTASDARLVSESSGQLTLAARRSATITAAGSGSVTVTGTPACTVTNTGSGTVSCGSNEAQRR